MPDNTVHLAAANGKPSIDAYVIDQKDEHGNIIKKIIGRQPMFVVYITREDKVGWRYDEMPEQLAPSIAEFHILTGISYLYLSEKQHTRALTLLAQSLYAAFLDNNDPIRHFKSPRDFINKEATHFSTLVYFFITTICGSLFIGLTLFFYYSFPDHENLRLCMFLGVTGGIIGALVSIMQRAKTLNIDTVHSLPLLILNGIIRVGLGGCFGFLFVVAVEANIALGHFAHDPWALLGLSAGAGFSERWVPELLGPHRE